MSLVMFKIHAISGWWLILVSNQSLISVVIDCRMWIWLMIDMPHFDYFLFYWYLCRYGILIMRYIYLYPSQLFNPDNSVSCYRFPSTDLNRPPFPRLYDQCIMAVYLSWMLRYVTRNIHKQAPFVCISSHIFTSFR